jgi:hypothetical protein
MKIKQTIRTVTLPILVGCALLLTPIGSQADTLPRVKPGAGDYEANPKTLPGGIYQSGAFSVVNEAGKRRIVATELASAITYPYYGKCDVYGVPLAAETIPISAKGRFSVRDKSRVKGGSLLVVWKGAWEKRTKVAGTLKVSYKDCSSKIKWVGRRTASPTG